MVLFFKTFRFGAFLGFFLWVFCLQQSFAKPFIDPEDEQFKTDLYLTDTQFFQKYVEKFTSVSPRFLLDSYKRILEVKSRIYVLRVAAQKKVWNDPAIAQLFYRALTAGILDHEFYMSHNVSNQWKLRAAAAFLIQQSVDTLENKTKLLWTKALLVLLREDPEEFVQGAAALALGKLFEHTVAPAHSEKKQRQRYWRYDLLNKEVIVQILNRRLLKISDKDQFLCWTLVKALGYTKSKDSFYPLLFTRSKGFHQKVRWEISRSISAIVAQSNDRAPEVRN